MQQITIVLILRIASNSLRVEKLDEQDAYRSFHPSVMYLLSWYLGIGTVPYRTVPFRSADITVIKVLMYGRQSIR